VIEKGKGALRELGICTIFELRSDRDVGKYQKTKLENEEIDVQRSGVIEQTWYELRLQGYADKGLEYLRPHPSTSLV